MDNDIDITDLIQKYEQMRYMDKSIYFDADEFAMLADYYNDLGDTSEAEHIVNIGMNMHPGSSELMIVKAKVLVLTEKYEEAYIYLSSIVEEDTSVDFLLLKFECLLNLDKIDEADTLLEVTLNSELDEEDLYTFITEVAYLYNDAERFETAIVLLERAMKYDDTNIDVLVDLSFAYEMINELKRAIELNNLILDLDPYSFDGWVNLGKLYTYNLQYDLSIEAFDFALTIKENDVDVLKLKALTYNLDDNYEAELQALNECIDNSPDDESHYDNLLKKYEEVGEHLMIDQYENILTVLEKKEARFGPKGVLLKRARIYLDLDRYEEAKEVFDRIPDEDRNTLAYYILEGDFAIHKQDYATAETAYMLAMLESPNDEVVLDTLSEISLDLNKYEKSAEYLELLIALNPDYPVAKFRLAYIRFEIGQKEPFDEILNQISDEELRLLLKMFTFITKKVESDFSNFSRQELLIRLDEARENRVLYKNIKY